MNTRWKPWLSVQVTHDFYRSGLSDDLRFVPAPSTALVLNRRGLLFKQWAAGFALLGRVEIADAPPNDESAPTALEAGTVLRFFVFARGEEIFRLSDLPPTSGPYLFFNRTASGALTAGAFVGAADLDPHTTAEAREAATFASIELTAPAAGWPQIGSPGGHDVVETVAFTLPFRRRSAVWRYHVVLKPGDTTTGTLSIVYAPPSSGPYPAGVTFGTMAAPSDVQASYPGRTIASFQSSAPLPFFEGALTKTALKRAGQTLIADLPNPRRQPSADVSDVLVELR